MKYNIFQGNKLIKNTIEKSLELEGVNEKDFETSLSQVLSEYYFQTFFYLFKRFGQPDLRL